jgi:DUF4097 and DUF4098 domain-containing protein YvlB
MRKHVWTLVALAVLFLGVAHEISLEARPLGGLRGAWRSLRSLPAVSLDFAKQKDKDKTDKSKDKDKDKEAGLRTVKLEAESDDCADIHITFSDWRTARAEEEITIPRAAAETLDAEPHMNGGVSVIGWERNDYSVRACKAAAARNYDEAEERVREVNLRVEGGRVRVSGSAGEKWSAHLIVRAPRGSSLRLRAHNGRLSVKNFDGRVDAETVNGPIDLHRVSGEIRASSQNGPLSVTRGGGNLRLRTENGPLHVSLESGAWKGAGLEANTQNGPVTLLLPDRFESPVRVDTSRHSPVECRASQCRTSPRTWEHPSRIEFGSGEPVVRLSTVNGPVEVLNAKPRSEYNDN